MLMPPSWQRSQQSTAHSWGSSRRVQLTAIPNPAQHAEGNGNAPLLTGEGKKGCKQQGDTGEDRWSHLYVLLSWYFSERPDYLWKN